MQICDNKSMNREILNISNHTGGLSKYEYVKPSLHVLNFNIPDIIQTSQCPEFCSSDCFEEDTENGGMGKKSFMSQSNDMVL